MQRQLAVLLIGAVALASAFSGTTALAQEKAPEKVQRPMTVYEVEFAVDEKEDGKPGNTRNYFMLLEDKGTGKVRAANRVPISMGEKGIQYMDVGLSIDCELRELDDGVSLRIWLEISDFATPGQEKASPPLVRTIRSEVQTAIPRGKPTVVSVIDDTATKRRYGLEVTATKVK